MTGSWGLTVPLPGLDLAAHAELLRALPDWGYTDAWSSEVAGADAFTPLALAAVAEPRLYLGTAIVPVFTRGPALIAQSAASSGGARAGPVQPGAGRLQPGDRRAVERHRLRPALPPDPRRAALRQPGAER